MNLKLAIHLKKKMKKLIFSINKVIIWKSRKLLTKAYSRLITMIHYSQTLNMN